ncbi:MAG: type I-E CRISPR-associated protein Cas6/Cse3/CasE [Actinomycetales bacterium]|nr:type I-E CRISPR-associated protein Cas6/Cse3/CasE [Actinomycetales bacterium]
MSHLTLVPAHLIRVRSWSDLGELHRVVMGFFASADLPGESTEKRLSRNILFRVDETGDGKVVLVRSDVAPTNLPPGAKTKEVETDSPQVGTPVRFRMTVNAIHRSRPENPSTKRGKGSTPVDDIDAWVTGRLHDALDDITVFTHDRSVGTSGKAPLQLDAINGYATVNDVDALEAHLRQGVGRSKAFGCGLLTIARA